MSETKDPRRTRRRASRTAGPPPAEDSITEKLETGAADPRSADKTGTADQPAAATAEPEATVRSAAATKSTPEATDAATEKVALGATEKPATEAATEKLTIEEAAAEATAVPAGESTDSADTVRLEKTDSSGSATADAASEAEPGEVETSGARPWKQIAGLAAAAVLVLGLVGAAVVSMLAVQSTQQRDERRSEYVATARQTVLNLTTIRADTAKEDIDRILTMASGDFKTEFDGRVDPFTEIVKQAKVVSTGEVVEAAVERDDEQSAVVLIAAKQTLTNAGSQEQQQRFYRFRVTVQRADDGTLTASDVKFVA